MLLQGFACDQAPATASAGLTLASPPASPPQLSAPNTLGNLYNSCRSLQALLHAPPPASSPSSLSSPSPSSPPSAAHLTPPLAHAPSPMKLRLRARKTDSSSSPSSSALSDLSTPPTPSSAKRIVKRQPVRRANKRRRAADDDAGRGDDDSSDDDMVSHSHTDSDRGFALQLLAPSPLRRYPAPGLSAPAALETVSPVPFHLPALSSSSSSSSSPNGRPTTPKRARIAPDALPLGLERADFHALHARGVPDDSEHKGTGVEREADGCDWSVEDDRMLVELVLEKLRLSREEWQDCARTLGKDRASLARRWKSLVLQGDVGFKSGRARSKIHSTWR